MIAGRTGTGRSGFSLGELAIGLGVTLLISGLLASFLTMVSRAALCGHTRADGMESVMLAAETLRRDASRLLYKEAADLAIGEDGRSINMLVAKDTLDADLWFADGEMVGYRLIPAPGTSGGFLLQRSDAKGTRTLPGCVLGALSLRHCQRGELSAQGSFLDITLRGVPSGRGAEPFSTRILVPVAPIQTPGSRRPGGTV